MLLVKVPKIRLSLVAVPFGGMCDVCCVCSSASEADDEREEKKLLASSGTDSRTSLPVPQEDAELRELREKDGPVGKHRRGETETEAQLRELLKTEREQKVVFASKARPII